MFGTYLAIARRHVVLIAVVGLVTSALAYVGLSAGEPVYRSEALVRVGTRNAADVVLGRDDRYEEPDRRVANELEVLASPAVLERAAGLLGAGAGAPTSEDLDGRVDFEQRGFSDAISVTAEDPTAEAAQDIVEAVVAAYIAHRQEYQRRDLEQLEADLSAQVEAVQAEIAALDAEAAGFPPGSPAALTTAVARSAAAQRYQNLANTLASVRLPLAGDLSGVEVISSASLPQVPRDADGLRTAILAVAAGLLAGGAAALIVELVRNPIRTADEAELVAAAPVLATLPWPKGNPRAGVLRFAGDQSDAAAAARGLRLTIEAVGGRGQVPQVVMVTGAQTDEDHVQLVALALSASCGRIGLRTLLVVDMASPQGLLSRARNGTDVASAAPPEGGIEGGTALPGVSWLPATSSPGHPDGPLHGRSLAASIDALRQAFDVVVIVPPPGADAAEAVAVGRTADVAVVVGALGRTGAKGFHRSVELLRRGGVAPLGVALTSTAATNVKQRLGTALQPPSDRPPRAIWEGVSR